MNEISWALRPAETKDRESIEDLLREADLPLEGLDEQFGEGYVVAEQDGEIVGAGGLEVYGKYGLLRSVVVRSPFQGGGLGEAIVGDRLRWSARQGLKAVYLLTTTVPRFFEKVGFTQMNRGEMPTEIQSSREFSEVCPVTAIAMVVRVDPLC
jgi:amino-acid N-acetyltransferase